MIPLLFALSCLPVDGPKLLAKHFASAIAAFTQVAPDTELGFSPVPGAVRVIRPLELQGMASRLGVTITLPTEGVCFEWTLAPLDSSRVAEAMQRVLPEGARLEVTEVSRTAVPAGELRVSAQRAKRRVLARASKVWANAESMYGHESA